MTGTSLMNYEEKWAQEAKAATTAEPLQAGTWLSARGGQLAIGDTILPGAQAAVIVLDMVRENTFYSGKFDPDSPMPPICYALGRDSDTMFPHDGGIGFDVGGAGRVFGEHAQVAKAAGLLQLSAAFQPLGEGDYVEGYALGR